MYEGNDEGLRNELDAIHDVLLILSKQVSKLINEQNNPNKEVNNILVSKVKWIHFVKEYEYKDKVFEQFLITFQDESKYYMDRRKNSKPQVEDGDTISYKIDGDKIREVRVLYDT